MLPKTHFMIEPFVSKLKSLHSNVEIAMQKPINGIYHIVRIVCFIYLRYDKI